MKLVIGLLTVFSASFAHAELLCSQPQNQADCALMSTSLSPLLPFLTTSNASQAKLIVAAQEDASVFLATEGAHRTAAFQHALAVVRSANPGAALSDFDIAQAILAAQ